MEVDVTVPRLGSTTMESAVLLRWLCSVGDHIVEGQALADLETDKIDVELPSPVAGVITALLASEGDELPVGAPVARVSVR
jgi:pyruvate/2-oxoglutarate dehydrogenase complex dihydrolipoamide acyltransferase (E2) component